MTSKKPTTILDGYYRTTKWPWYCHIINGTLWGFSIYKNTPGYRTAGISVTHWLARPENKNVKLIKDEDRTLDENFIKGYKLGQKLFE